jgi:hypothetical protein
MKQIEQRDIMYAAVGSNQLGDILDLSDKSLTFPPSITTDVAGNVIGNVTGDLTSNNGYGNSLTNAAVVLKATGGAIVIDNSGQKRISWNDGGGNFNIRSGNYHDGATGVVYAKGSFDTNGGAATITLASDAVDGAIILATAPIGTPGSTFSYTSSLTLDKSNLTLQGSFGIGVTPSYKLQLSTDSAAKPSTNTWTIASDARVKENVRPYTKGLDAIAAIRPVMYDYNGKAGFDKIADNIGVIAQEIQGIVPEGVSSYQVMLNPDDDGLTELFNFNSHSLTYILINAVKELKAIVESQATEITSLRQSSVSGSSSTLIAS